MINISLICCFPQMCKLNLREVLSYTLETHSWWTATSGPLSSPSLPCVIPQQPPLIIPTQAAIPWPGSQQPHVSIVLVRPCAYFYDYLSSCCTLSMIDEVGVRHGCLHGPVVSYAPILLPNPLCQCSADFGYGTDLT